jgi:DNA-binding MarR family transcriptional regulator
MPDSPDPITVLVLDTARLIRQRFERELEAAGLGITAGEARALLWAGRFPGLRQSALADKLNVEPMTLVGFLDRLEGRGLVERMTDPTDRRAKLVQPTPAAAPLIRKIEEIANAVRSDATGALDHDEEEALRSGLAAMRAALVREIEPVTV